MTEKTGPAIDRSIYPMPMFVNLVSRDLDATQALYAAAGFVALATIPGRDGAPLLVHLRREKFQDILVIRGTSVSGSTTASFAAGDVDLVEVAKRLRAAGAEVTGPYDTSWFATDVAFTDADGNKIILTAPRTVDQRQAREWVGGNITGDFEVPGRTPFNTDRQ
jgi:predicted lactoylglutathione lyase